MTIKLTKKNQTKLPLFTTNSCLYSITAAVNIKPIDAEHTPDIIPLIFFCLRYIYQYGIINNTNKKQGRYNPPNADNAPQISLVIMPPIYIQRLNIGPGMILINEKPL